jgi:Fic family protein
VGKHSFKSRDEEEVVGYADTLTEIYRSWEHIPLSENHIKQLHGMALKHSSKDQRHRGEYKKSPNNVVAANAEGKVVGIVFKTATPFETPQRMLELVSMTRAELESKEQHPLLIIGAFVVHFLAIHPFQDGNGRLSRILSNLLLLRHGYSYVPYSSLEHVVEGNKAAYYLALRSTQKTLGKGKGEDLHPWLLFFLRSLKAQKDYLQGVVQEAQKFSALDKLDSDILKAVEKHGKLGLSALVKLTGAKKDTMKVRLSKLVKASRLERNGKGPATFYQRSAEDL